jgi:multiple sugar transport system permease protein
VSSTSTISRLHDPPESSPARRWRLGVMLRYATAALVALLFLGPIFWMVSSSLKGNNQIFATPPVLFPSHPQFTNYHDAVNYIPFWTYLRNSFLTTIAAVVGTIVSCVPVAYALSFLKWRLKSLAFGIVLVSMMLPFPAIMIPWYIVFRHLGWIGSLWPLSGPPFVAEFVTPAFSSAIAVFLLRQFFVGIPQEIVEAAKIDGAGHTRILWQIIRPLARPVLTTVVIMTFLASWTAFIGPLIFQSSTNVFTLSVGLQQYQSQHFTAYNLLLAASVLFLVPVLVVFIFGQRYFVQGSSRTGLK